MSNSIEEGVVVMRVPLAAVAAAFGVGIGMAWWLRPSLPLLIGFIGAVFLCMQSCRRPSAANLCLIGLVVAIGVLRAGCDAQIPSGSIQPLLAADPKPIFCDGVLVSDVEWTKPLHGPARRRAWFHVTRIRQYDDWIPACGRLLVHLPAIGQGFAYGDRVRIHGSVRAPRAEASSRFDEARWLWVNDACGVLNVSGATGIVQLGSSNDLWSRYRRWIAGFRQQLRETGRLVTGPEEGAYLEALLLGEGRGIPSELADLFRRTGTIHILVVSGFQVGLVGLIGFTLLSLLRIPRAVRILLVGAGLILYCSLTGANAPILRATVTGVLLCVGWYRGQGVSPLNSLAAAAVLILFFQPKALADASFQLSFAAVIGLLTLTPWCARKWFGKPSPVPQETVLPVWIQSAHRWIIQSLAASCGAWCAVTPVAAWHFHQITPVALLANLVVVPLSSLLIVTGFLLYLTAWISPALTGPCAASFQALTLGLSAVVRWAAHLPGASWSW